MKVFNAILARVIAPFLVVLLGLVALYFGFARIANPFQYQHPDSLFFERVKFPDPPQPKPIPRPIPVPPPLHKYVAGGSITEKVRAPRETIILDSKPEDSEIVLDLKEKASTSTKEKAAKHLAVFIAIDDSGSMGGNDPHNDRYQVARRLMDKLSSEDVVCIGRTQMTPEKSTKWLSPRDAQTVIDGALSPSGMQDFPNQESNLTQAMIARLGELSADNYKSILLFFGDGDASNFGYDTTNHTTKQLLLDRGIAMSGVIFGLESDTLRENGSNHFLVTDAEATGGAVAGASDVSKVDHIMQGYMEKALKSISTTRSIVVTFQSRKAYKTGDTVVVQVDGKPVTVKVQ